MTVPTQETSPSKLKDSASPEVESSIAIAEVNAAIAEFTEAVALIETAVDSIDQHTETAKQNINNHVETTIKLRIDKLAVEAVSRAIQAYNRLKELLDTFMTAVRIGG